jgi:hypothetical protein
MIRRYTISAQPVNISPLAIVGSAAMGGQHMY